MWTSLALAATLGLSVGQTDQLSLTNVRAIYSLLGPERPNDKVLPGDAYWLAFDILGLKEDETGKVRYSMTMQVFDTQGKLIFGKDPEEVIAYNTLGGGRTRGYTYVLVTFNQPAGEYTIKVTTTDLSTKASANLSRKFEILPKDFGLVNLTNSYDPNGRLLAPPGGAVGQTLWVTTYLVGFKRGTNKQPKLTLELVITDSDGKPATPKPPSADITQLEADNVDLIPRAFAVRLNRPGKFMVELRATDQVTNKKASVSFPITVTELESNKAGAEK
jgi:hypothetical protein